MKALLYCFAACLYAMQICVICWAEFILHNIPFGFVFIIFAVLFLIAAFALGCVNLTFGLGQMTNPKSNMCKTVMIVKLILMPFFVINFLIGFLVVAVCANPFLFMALWIVIPVMCVLTYAEMLVTSSYNIGALIHRIMSKQNTFGELALFIVSQFLYFLDVIGAIIIFIRHRKCESIQPDGVIA